jgi:LacI family transcriptional regulator
MKGKEITIYDLAQQLQLSSATVSRALKDDPLISSKTRKRIFDLAEKMGYRTNYFARNLRSQKTNTIGCIVHELQSNFINSVLAGIEKVTAEAGYDLLIAHSAESYKKEMANAKNLFHKRVDGLIASLSIDTANLDHFSSFSEKSVPVVFFDRVEKSNNYASVIIDNHLCGYIATEHLIEQGCKKIVLVTSNLARNVYSERLRGYKDALSDHGIPYEESLVIINDLSEKAGISAAHQILAMRPMPDGAFIANDFVAAVSMRVLKENNVAIPDDIAIVGFNNDVIGKIVEPALTTIHYAGREMGEVAAGTIIAHLRGESSIQKINTIIINSDIIVRQSSLKRKTDRGNFI